VIFQKNLAAGYIECLSCNNNKEKLDSRNKKAHDLVWC